MQRQIVWHVWVGLCFLTLWYTVVHYVTLRDSMLHCVPLCTLCCLTLCYMIWQVRCKSFPPQAPDPEIVVTALGLELRTLFLRFTLANAALNYSEHFSELALHNAMFHRHQHHISPTSATKALFYSSLTSTVDASLVSATMRQPHPSKPSWH